MPAPTPIVASAAANKLIELGKQIRAQRKMLRINATAAAAAAGMSRVTLYRIEKGEPSVTMGAYLNAMIALNMDFGIITQTKLAADEIDIEHQGWIPARIRLSDYPQLKQLAWQVHGTDELTPVEALSIPLIRATIKPTTAERYLSRICYAFRTLMPSRHRKRVHVVRQQEQIVVPCFTATYEEVNYIKLVGERFWCNAECHQT